MTIKSVLATVSSDEVGKSVLEVALQIAQGFNAHIEAFHARADPRGLVPYTGEGMDGSMIEEIMEVTEREGGERATTARRMFDAFRSRHDVELADAPRSPEKVTVAWREEMGREEELVAVRGRLFDLTVVGQPLKDAALPSPATLESALLDTGRPIVIAPPEPPASTAKTVAIAWETSPEAARAVSDSLPLLKRAETVTVLDPDFGQPDVLKASDLVARLAWHGIGAKVHGFEARVTELGAAFLQGAADVGADLLVKGAYSQSRLRQLILGGRTRHIIANTTIPVLLSK